ncbi:MAG: protein kinase [Proteobacteria bacterium]|nr:protein kinase [Pseudomonadota bacterium]
MTLESVIASGYTIESLAGTGGMGSIYKARDRYGRGVALKIVQVADQKASRRFVREANLLCQLRHPTIVRYLESGITDRGGHFLAMEWLEGIDLGQRLLAAPLSVAETLELGIRVATALGFAHARRVVHRDIKPSNIFLPGCLASEAKLLDFGIARSIDPTWAITGGTHQYGTPAYMSPEQVRGSGEPTPRADVFALGCVLYQCLTGTAPFAAHDPMAMFCKIAMMKAPSLHQVQPQVPEEVGKLIDSMLAKNPRDRPRNGAEAAAAIAAIADRVSPTDRVCQPAARPRRAITDVEKRWVNVVVAVPTEDPVASRPGQGQDRPQGTDRASFCTSPQAPANQSAEWQEACAFMESLGVRCSSLSNGTLVAVLETPVAAGQRTVIDQVANTARCALALQRSFPDAAVGVASGLAAESDHGEAGYSARSPGHPLSALGAIIERAVSLASASTCRPDIPARDARRSSHGAERPGGRRFDRPAGSSRWPLGRSSHAGSDREATVQVDNTTRELLGAGFEITGDGEPGWTLVSERRVEELLTVRPEAMPFVGRRRELALLMATVTECIQEKVARAVVITGAPGYGKSRLVRELVVRLADLEVAPEIWIARGDPMRAGLPLALLSAAVGQACSAAGRESAENQSYQLKRYIREYLPTRRARDVIAFVAELLGVANGQANGESSAGGPERHRSSGEHGRAPRSRQDLDQAGLCSQFLAARTASGPLVLVLDDVQWADRASLDLLDAVLRDLVERPFAVIAIGRPEVHDSFPQLWGTHNLTAIHLGRLHQRAAKKLARGALGDGPPEHRIDALVKQADGNARCLEALMHNAADGEQAVPTTALVMVQNQLCALNAQARQVLRAASVFGRRFCPDGVAALLPDSALVHKWLPELAKRELLSVFGPLRPSGPNQYSFCHPLIREAVYETLTEADRKLGHLLAGDWLEQAGEADGLAIAEQFIRGDATARALPYLLGVAEDALKRGDFAVALTLAEQGLQCGASGEMLNALQQLQKECSSYGRRAGDRINGPLRRPADQCNDPDPAPGHRDD